jgi:hypothetical protein
VSLATGHLDHLVLVLADTCRTTSISSHPGRALVPGPSRAKVLSIIERTAIYNTTTPALRLHLPAHVTLFCRLDPTPRLASPVFCMSGDAVRSLWNPDHWPTSHTTAASCCPSPVPLTAATRSSVVLISQLYIRRPQRSRQQRSPHHRRLRGARAVLPAHCVAKKVLCHPACLASCPSRSL